MSIVDDTHDLHSTAPGSEPDNERDAGLWHALGAQVVAKAKGGRAPATVRPDGDLPAFEGAAPSEDLWRTKIDLVVSAGLSGDAARRDDRDSARARSEVTFDAFREHCAEELRPVLESSAEMLGRWGLQAHVNERLRDVPSRLPRSFDLSLSIERFEGRGPGRLTITATEACDFVRVKLKVGPTRAREVDEHVGTTVTRDLSDALTGGLVATLVERIFGA